MIRLLVIYGTHTSVLHIKVKVYVVLHKTELNTGVEM